MSAGGSTALTEAALPCEVFAMVLEYLSGRQAWRCRRVCRLWRARVDALGEAYWRRACMREHDHALVARAYAAARLPWSQLYRSLGAWSSVGHARVRVRALSAGPTDALLLLGGGVLACPQAAPGETRARRYRAVAYYDLYSPELSETRRETFDFDFASYAENERLLVVGAPRDDFDVEGECCEELVAVLRPGGARLRCARGVRRWMLRGDELFAQDTALTLLRLVPEPRAGELRAEPLAALAPHRLDDVVRVRGALRVLTEHCGRLTMQLLDGARARESWRVQGDDLVRLGFEFTSQDWVRLMCAARAIPNVPRAVCPYGQRVLVGTRGAPLSLLVLAHVDAPAPSLTVPLDAHRARDARRRYTAMQQIEVVETRGGHRVLLLLHAHAVLAVDLEHASLLAAAAADDARAAAAPAPGDGAG